MHDHVRQVFIPNSINQHKITSNGGAYSNFNITERNLENYNNKWWNSCRT